MWERDSKTERFKFYIVLAFALVDSSWNVMAHSDAREGKWRGNWRMEWVASTFHTISQHGVSSITTADAHTSAASSRLNWRPRRFKWTRLFHRKTQSGFCACVITFQLAFTIAATVNSVCLHPQYKEMSWYPKSPVPLCDELQCCRATKCHFHKALLYSFSFIFCTRGSRFCVSRFTLDFCYCALTSESN